MHLEPERRVLLAWALICGLVSLCAAGESLAAEVRLPAGCKGLVLSIICTSAVSEHTGWSRSWWSTQTLNPDPTEACCRSDLGPPIAWSQWLGSRG